MDVGPGGNLERELAYRSHSADKYASEVWEKAVGDVKTARAIVFPARCAGMVRDVRIHPVGVVEEKKKMRIIHDSIFSGAHGSRGGANAGGMQSKKR